MTDDGRSIELEVEVEGTPEEVWRAIATGPGISSWYVPHQIEEREGGSAKASFGPGMEVDGRVAAWDPPHRVVFDGGDPAEGLAFEWLVEARDGGSCIVRLVNSGFASGEEWDDHYDGMTEGWRLFLSNLQLHLRHFSGQSATAMLPMASWPMPQAAAWDALTESLGLSTALAAGDRLEVSGEAPPLAGSVVEAAENKLVLMVDEPAPGTAFIVAEGAGDETRVSVWVYLYGAAGATAAARDDALWRAWFEQHAPA